MSLEALVALSMMRFRGTASFRDENCTHAMSVQLDRTTRNCSSSPTLPSTTTCDSKDNYFTQAVDCLHADGDGIMNPVPHVQLLTGGKSGCDFFSLGEKNKNNANASPEFKLLTLARLGACMDVFDTVRLPPSLLTWQKNVAAVVVRLNSSSSQTQPSTQSMFVAQYAQSNCASSSLLNTYPLGPSNGACIVFDATGVSSSALLTTNYGATLLTLHSSESSCSSASNKPVSFHYTFSQSKCESTPANTCAASIPAQGVQTSTDSSLLASVACTPHFTDTAHLDLLKSQRPAWTIPSQNSEYVYIHTFLDTACTALRAAHIVKLDTCIPQHIRVPSKHSDANQTVLPTWITRDAEENDEDDFEDHFDDHLHSHLKNGDTHHDKQVAAYRLALDPADSTVYKTEYADTLCTRKVADPLDREVVGRVNTGCVNRVFVQWNSPNEFSSTMDAKGGGAAPTITPGNSRKNELAPNTATVVGTSVFFGVVGLALLAAFAHCCVIFQEHRNKSREQRVDQTVRDSKPNRSSWLQWLRNGGRKKGKGYGAVPGDSEAVHVGDGVFLISPDVRDD
ncbi:hypothetical protein BJ741DRAFT_715465 [Chytriomyces cf. hyalinus JEL632]|nr:hypothetical protein BJ741DRAFT_715465 [Chytriomyces cf. hyalinus JEL632]